MTREQSAPPLFILFVSFEAFHLWLHRKSLSYETSKRKWNETLYRRGVVSVFCFLQLEPQRNFFNIDFCWWLRIGSRNWPTRMSLDKRLEFGAHDQDAKHKLEPRKFLFSKSSSRILSVLPKNHFSLAIRPIRIGAKWEWLSWKSRFRCTKFEVSSLLRIIPKSS